MNTDTTTSLPTDATDATGIPEADIQTRLAKARDDVLHYEGCLDRYGHGRWHNMGKRRLAELKQIVSDIETEAFGGHDKNQENGPVA